MERRFLATIAATACSAAALTAAVGATTHLFAAGDAAAGVGTISPVSTTRPAPVVEHRVVDVDDPAPAATPASAPGPEPLHLGTAPREPVREPTVRPPTTTAAPAAAPAPPATVAAHDTFEPGDD